MAENTVIQQGRFTSDAATRIISLRADVDWMCVYNFTNAGATGDDSVKFFWQRGMADANAIRYFKSGGGNNLNLNVITTLGFTRIDTSNNPLTAAIAVTAGTDAVQPVYSTADTGSLVIGSVVLLSSLTGQENLAGIEFQVDTVNVNTDFRILSIATAPGAAATAGNWRQVRWDPIFYPRRRFISDITTGVTTIVDCTADHGLTVGQQIRMVVPAAYAMVEMDGLQATLTAVTATTMTLDIDSTAFTAFAFPLPAAVPFSPSLVVPFGQDTPQSLTSAVDILGDATDNQSVIAMSLGGGADAPGGGNNDVMYWVAGRSFDVTNL